MVLTERRNKIFLIGNGFDLAHNLPTKYIDFIRWYLRECCLNAIGNGTYEDDCVLINIERGYFLNQGQEIEEQIHNFFEKDEIWSFIPEKTISVTSNFTKVARSNNSFFKIEPKGEFCYNLFSNCRNSDWSGIEDEINRIMIKEHMSLTENRTKILINKSSNQAYQTSLKKIRSLNKSIFQLKSKLIEYLKQYNDPALNKHYLISDNNIVRWGDVFSSAGGQVKRNNIPYFGNVYELNRHVLFLNFNYTTYFESQIVDSIKEASNDSYTKYQTIFIHGDLEEPIDNIVFGVGDENKEIYSEIESLYDNDWLEPLKSFHYFRNQKYQQLLGFIAKGEYEVYVIGHSCSITDRTLLNMLFENDSCRKIHVYHYSGINSYLATAYNIARNFNDKVRLRRVLQPFNPDLTTK